MRSKSKSAINAYFASRWLPAGLCFGLGSILVLLLGMAQWLPLLASPFVLVGLVIAFLGWLGAIAYTYTQKQRSRLITHLITLGIFLALSYFVGTRLLFFLAVSPLDGFAKRLTIPDNIEIFEPVDGRTIGDESFEDPFQSAPPIDSFAPHEASLELISVSQPGIYKAVIWANPGEAGYFYLQAFEVTKGTPLSAGSLAFRTQTTANWSEDSDTYLRSESEHFTIYEGDWGDPYAARFEVWFMPEGNDANGRKVSEKFFKIEGWQR